jgi:glycosyltransferase A (GT-A) superfamily protein (DUF2064 family)
MPGVLVVAKAPVPGLAKTRLAAVVGTVEAADLAAAALLDTLDAAEAWAPASRRLIALVGDLRRAARGDAIGLRLRASGWSVVRQRGASFAERLVNSHHDAGAVWGRSVALVQVGTDTPQLTAGDLDRLASAVTAPKPAGVDAAIGPAADGGWWGLATRRAGHVDRLRGVEMSTSHTCDRTADMLRAGATVALAHELRDVDTFADLRAVVAQAPHTRFASAVNALGVVAV